MKSKKLTDTDQMPFGKYGPYKGDPRQMANVPDDYLYYLYDVTFSRKIPNGANGRRVFEYIEENLDSIIENSKPVNRS